MSDAARTIPTPLAYGDEQIKAALRATDIVSEEYPLAPWTDMRRAIGPLLPGMLIVAGARPGQGKTSLLANWFSELYNSNKPTLYCISGDGGPTRFRRILAAMHCGLSRRAALRNEWHDASRVLSGAEARTAFRGDLERQRSWQDVGMVYDLPLLNRDKMREALHYGLDRGARVIFVDHVNRWTPDQNRDLTRDLADAVRALAAVAAEKKVTIILAAQITPWGKDTRNALSEFRCPPLSALKQTQALVEEPAVVLMLHRAQRPDVTADDIRAASEGRKQARDLIEPGIMCVTVGKHRDDDTVGMTVRLRIDHTGLVQDEA